MDNQYPVYTLHSECQDCYKCVRGCPVKAIRIDGGRASVISDSCIACGQCISLCPRNAKQVRNDSAVVYDLISSGVPVVASLAPSWRGSFSCSSSQMISSLKELGFHAVSETALGAQEVSMGTLELMRSEPARLWISSACPAVVDYLKKYKPRLVSSLVPLASPAATHGHMLKEHYGQNACVVFIGPCSAKKGESDLYPDNIDTAIGFNELDNMFRKAGINPDTRESGNGTFEPSDAFEGALYPLEGGMSETMLKAGAGGEAVMITVSTIPMIREMLDGMDGDSLSKPVFIEALACQGGCMAGPCTISRENGLQSVLKVRDHVRERSGIPMRASTVVSRKFFPTSVQLEEPSAVQIRQAMLRIGKKSVDDELNCGGCGYNTCRELAKALVRGNAEAQMCISYMRRIAARKAGAVFNCMPSGILMVDSTLKILETNKSFVRMFAPDLLEGFDEDPGCLTGGVLDKILPCGSLFESVLETGKDLHKEHYPMNRGLYEISIFSIEANQLVGAVIADVTESEMHRDQIAKKAHSVIAKNMAIVQDIACRLGEHMVETELLLTSIAEGYDPELDTDERGESDDAHGFLNGLGRLYE